MFPSALSPKPSDSHNLTHVHHSSSTEARIFWISACTRLGFSPVNLRWRQEHANREESEPYHWCVKEKELLFDFATRFKSKGVTNMLSMTLQPKVFL